MFAQEVTIDQLVPEGWDDLSCEGPTPWQVQAKSRQARIGDFPLAEGARHVLASWRRHIDRPATAGHRLVLVFERAVAGYAPSGWDTSLGTDPDCAELAEELTRRAAANGLGESAINRLLEITSITVLPRNRLQAEAAALIGGRTGLSAGAAVPVIGALCAAIAESTDRNAAKGWSERSALSRTDVEGLVWRAVELVDVASLEEAVRSGACEPVDLETPLHTPDFYAGTGVQPGHVAAGLIVPRPDVTDDVLAGLEATGSALIVGPSGIGKSAVLWMAAYVARHVIWYRVHRLRESDVEPLVRLARATAGEARAAVGFLVDGIGIGELTAWDSLHRRVAGMPQVLLIGTVREEDLLPLATSGEAVHVRPRLDASVAARIHAALLERHLTTAAHWLEAYEAADGLTLEFTHLLTQGQRLGVLVGNQVEERVRAGRGVELAILAPASVSHRWGASLSLESITRLVGASQADLKIALSRLVREHVITLQDGNVQGLHQLRSAAICDAVHAVPPPRLSDTVGNVVKELDSRQIAGFLARALSTDPELGDPLSRDLVDRIRRHSADQPHLAAAALTGLRLADFTMTARRWAHIVEAHEVPPPMRPITLNLAMLDTEVGDLFDPRVRAAVHAIREERDDSNSPLRDALIQELGTPALDAILSDSGLVQATELLSAIAGSELPLNPAAASSLGALVADAAPPELAALLAAAHQVSPIAGQAFLELAGGVDAVLARILRAETLLLDLEVIQDGAERVLRGRLLHVSDRANPDPHEHIVGIARLGLQCLPGVDRADLTTVTACGEPLGFGGHVVGSTGLLRRYALGRDEISWNRARGRYARSLSTAESTTARLATGLALLEGTAKFLDRAADAWIGNRSARHLVRLDHDQQRLKIEIQTLVPRPMQDPLSEPAEEKQAGGLGDDPLHTLINGIVSNLVVRLFAADSGAASMAAFARDTLLAKVPDVEREPWQLLGLERPPAALGRIRRTLSQLADVLDELASDHTTRSALTELTRRAAQGDRVRRGAALVAERAVERHSQVLMGLVHDAAARGWEVQPLTRPDDRERTRNWPPLHTALIVAVSGFDQLPEAWQEIVRLVADADLPGKSVDLLPAVQSRVVPRLAFRAQSGQLYPLSGLADPWSEQLGPVPLTPAADNVAAALAALQELSALALLREQRSIAPDVQALVDAAWDAVSVAVEGLQRLPDDRVVGLFQRQVAQVAEQVGDELDDAGTGPAGAFAAAMSAGSTTPTDELATASLLIGLATQWDLDPSVALTMID